MSVDRNELHELVDELPDDQLALVAADLRRRTQSAAPRRVEPFAWFGMIDDPSIPSDLAENAEKYMEGFGAPRS